MSTRVRPCFSALIVTAGVTLAAAPLSASTQSRHRIIKVTSFKPGEQFRVVSQWPIASPPMHHWGYDEKSVITMP